MALRLYKKETLNGNWFEERAPPLKGVIADYGPQKGMYSTTSKSHFVTPGRNVASKPTPGMMGTALYLKRAENKSVNANDIASGFGKTHRLARDPKELRLRSSYNESFGERSTADYFDERESKSSRRKAAGGAPGGPTVPDGVKTKVISDSSYMSLRIGNEGEGQARGNEPRPRQITFGLTATHSDMCRIKEPKIFQDE